jgi:hypothetical protein
MDPRRITSYAVASVLLAIAFIVPANAIGASSFTLDFPAGEACSFALEVSGTGGNNSVHHAGNGMIVSGGTGSALTFSGNGNSVSFPSNGGAMLTRTNPDGSYTFQTTGHNVLILFPTDNPAGPSTTLIVGRATVSVSADGTYTVQSLSGRQVDVCARLAS